MVIKTLDPTDNYPHPEISDEVRVYRAELAAYQHTLEFICSQTGDRFVGPDILIQENTPSTD